MLIVLGILGSWVLLSVLVAWFSCAVSSLGKGR